MISFDGDLHDYGLARRKEFILTAAGAYCSSSLAGNTRKYHGLLVAHNRVYLAGIEEDVAGERLSVARLAGALDDRGLRYLNGFELYPPRFYYFIGDARVKKTIEFNGRLTIRYDVAGEAELRLRPLVTDRGYHETRRNVRMDTTAGANGFKAGKLAMTSDLRFSEDPRAYRDVLYERDEERGYDHVEDLFSPGYFYGRVKDGTAIVEAGLEGLGPAAAAGAAAPADEIGALEAAADGFVVGDAVYAGYHWFAEPWGRDTFISLPGLLLERGRFDEAERVFRHFARLMKNGLIPNRIPGGYNSSDAPLWFVYALDRYFKIRENVSFYRESKAYVEAILYGYPESGVARLDGGLISVKPETTWMDTPFTPRGGKPVEVNALWVHALAVAEEMGIAAPEKPNTALNELGRFWNEKKGCLYDVIDPFDDAVRPNQAIAIALGVVRHSNEKSALGVVRRELLTPYGLRTLSPRDRRYKGRFRGDASYHNGCVWPWLMGFYVDATLRAGEPEKNMAQLLRPLLLHTHDAGLGTISEIFDGDPPHEPNGCISQAWSVAEVLRAHKKIKGLRP